MLARLKRRLPDAKDDALLTDLLEEARAFILAYTGRDEVPETLGDAQVRIAAILFNRMGMEGEASHGEGGVTRTNGCVISDTVHIAYNGMSPQIDGIQIRNRGPRTFEFNALNPQHVVGYEWDFGDGSPRSTAANPTHEYTTTGNFTVKCYISSTCGTLYDTMAVHILSTSVNNIDKSQKITVYPNPTTDQVNVKVDDVNVKIQRIIIMNVLGQSIEQNEFKTPQNEVLINMSNISAGTYQLFVETTNGTTVEKVIKTQ